MRGLVYGAMQGDKEAFVELIRQNTQAMYKVARSILSNEEDIADAIQDTILTCYEKIRTLKRPQYFKTWLTRILINHCNDIVRQGKRVLPGEIYQSSEGSQKEIEHWEFLQVLSSLDDKYRLIVVLYYVQGFPVKEIASLLDMKEATVKTRLKRGRECLRRMYGLETEKSSYSREITSQADMPACSFGDCRGGQRPSCL